MSPDASRNTPDPLEPWGRFARALMAAADHLEAFLMGLQSGDAPRARHHLDASRHARARCDRLRKEAEREAGEKVPEALAEGIGRQVARVSLADEVLEAVLPLLPAGPAGSERFVDQQIGPVWDLERDAVVLVGVAASQHAEAFRARGYRRVFAVVEAGDRTPARGVLKGVPDLERALLALREDPPARYVCLGGARGAFSDKVQASVRFMLSAFSLEAGLSGYYSVVRILNCVGNIPALVKSVGLGELKRPLEGRPALIVCPGPSLDRSLEVIKAHRSRFVLFAVNHAVGNLGAQGLTPDLIALLDPYHGMADQLAGHDLHDVKGLITCGSVAPAVARLPWVRRVLSGNFNGTHEAWLDALTGPQLRLESGGTVAHVAAAAAVRLGCNPIVFVGQDLAYQGRKLYASDTLEAVEVDVSEEQGVAQEGALRRELTYAEGWAGERLQTSRAFEAYRIWYERWIPTHPRVRFINCSEGGARIRGMTHLPLASVVERLPPGPIDVDALMGPTARARRHLPPAALDEAIRARVRLLLDVYGRLAPSAVEDLALRAESVEASLAAAVEKLRAIPEGVLMLEAMRRRTAQRLLDCLSDAERATQLEAHAFEMRGAVATLACAYREVLVELSAEASPVVTAAGSTPASAVPLERVPKG